MATVHPGPNFEPLRKSVLVVDDNAEGRRALARYLELHDFRVIECADGASALAAFQAGPPPDFVLTDMMLPDMDGRELGRHARQLQPRPLVALLTGWVFEPDATELNDWGIDLVFYKPVNIRDLLRELQQRSKGRPESSERA